MRSQVVLTRGVSILPILAEGIDKFIKPCTLLINSLEEKVKKLAPVSR
ncbi:MAG: hypothetical protein WBA93_14255 [Microcoleaceae cyanobacterium]